MTIDEAIIILERHNQWRRGGEGEMIHPATLGLAIDVIISDFKEKNK